MSLNGFYVGGPFNCSLSHLHTRVCQTNEWGKTQADKETERHRGKQKHKLPPHSAHLILQAFFVDIFSSYKRKRFHAFCCFYAWCLHSLERFSLERVASLVSHIHFQKIWKKKAEKGYFEPFITFIEYSHREKRPTLSLEGWGLGLRAAFCALQRTPQKSSGNAGKTTGPAFPREPHL